MIPEFFKITHLIRAQRIFHIKHLELFKFFYKVQCIDGRQPFMDIMQKFHIPPDVISYFLKKLHCALHITLRAVIHAVRRIFRFVQFLGRAVHGSPVGSHLTSYIAISLFLQNMQIFCHFLYRISVRMFINGNPLPAFSAEQFIQRQSRDLSLDIPERLINAGYRIV